jgi:cell division septation protein DedD
MSTDVRGAREYAADDGFHEIQLSGKQLVFLFMATTVVSVVIFLCGVLVGRGGRTDVASREALGTPVGVTGAGAAIDEQGAAPNAVLPSADPGLDKPTDLSADDSSYYAVLNGDDPDKAAGPPAAEQELSAASAAPVESVAPPSTTPAAPPARVEPRPEPRPAAPAAVAPAAPAAVKAPAAARQAGYTIQVSAFRIRSQADQLAAQLKAKRYDAFVVEPDTTSPLFRVRVGSFPERRDATGVVDRLKKDKFKPWVTR